MEVYFIFFVFREVLYQLSNCLQRVFSLRLRELVLAPSHVNVIYEKVHKLAPGIVTSCFEHLCHYDRS